MASKPQKVQRTPFIRLLPVLIAVAALMLSVRVNDIRKGFLDLPSVRVAGELQAQQPDPKAPPAADAQQPAQPAAPQGQSAPKPAAAQTASVPSGEPAGGFSPTEMDVLQKLQERRGVLDDRERDIARRESLLKAAENQIERKISEMKTLQNTIESLLRQYNDQEDQKMRSLVKIYENMKPKEAAKIFEQLDMAVMLEVVERMKEAKVAPILAEMDPGKARTLTLELAQRRQMPLPRPTQGG
jgi:flagellar motility protein MotE (MotC chaperone)